LRFFFLCSLNPTKAMAARRGTSLLRLLQQSTSAQVARYQPNSAPAAQLATPAFATSPAQSILRRFFSVDDTYASARDGHHAKEYERAKMVSEGGPEHTSFDDAREEITTKSDVSRSVQGDAQRAANKAEDKAGEAAQKGKEYVREKSDKVSDAAGDMKEKAKETVSNAAEKTSETWEQAKDKAKDTADGMTGKAQQTADATKGKAYETKAEGEGVAQKVKERASKEADTAKDMVKDIPAKTSETAQGLKEVGVEAAKAIKRDAEKLAEKVGLKSRD